MRIDWTDAENDRIVASYFAMLGHELRRESYTKASYRRALLPNLNHRSEGSVEWKYGNISAVLVGLGEPWIAGYQPAPNFQTPLVDAVARWLAIHPDWMNRPPDVPPIHQHIEETMIVKGPPPAQSDRPVPTDTERVKF